MASAMLHGGPCDGDQVEVDLDWFLPPGQITVVALSLDEQAETVEWTQASYRRFGSSLVEQTWAYVYSGGDITSGDTDPDGRP